MQNAPHRLKECPEIRHGNTIRAFMLRLKPSGIDRLEYALDASRLFVGWSAARGLDAPDLDWPTFRGIVQKAHGYTRAQAGRSAGTLWRFIRDMTCNDLVAVPAGPVFYLAEVKGRAEHDTSRQDDTSWHRPCRWLNGGDPFARTDAPDGLANLLRARHICLDATDLLDEFHQLLR